jgi:hypothetical protein
MKAREILYQRMRARKERALNVESGGSHQPSATSSRPHETAEANVGQEDTKEDAEVADILSATLAATRIDDLSKPADDGDATTVDSEDDKSKTSNDGDRVVTDDTCKADGDNKASGGAAASGKVEEKGRAGEQADRRRVDPELAHKLYNESQAAKRDRTISFDLNGPGRVSKWLDDNLPSKVKRSDGVGQILLIGQHRSAADMVKASPEKLAREAAARQEWLAMLETEGSVITYDTFNSLAAKHKVTGGKWIAHIKV